MDDLTTAIARFMAIGAEAHVMRHASLKAGAELFLEKAKAALGTYEYGWPRLADSTLARKSHGDTPGLETGEMRDSGGYEIHGDHFIVGFSSPKIVWFEFGTKSQPPRPVVGGTIDRHGQEIANRMGVVFGMVMGEALAIGSVASAARNILGGGFR